MSLAFRYGVLLVGLAGCELFTTRTAEPPSGPVGGWTFPSSPRVVVQNLESAVGRRSGPDYIRSFAGADAGSAGFTFIPDKQTAATHSERFLNWNYEREERFAQNLFRPAVLPYDSLSEFTSSIDRETILGDSSSLVAQYTWRAGHLNNPAPRDLSGRMDLTLRRASDGGWYIEKWSDSRTGGDCLSDLKVYF
ncbi:MAG: hypothetical protein FJY67_03800 [Calditrichaeota bacterium]|nr:hypothetical protein [Calditrichota bacterium]